MLYRFIFKPWEKTLTDFKNCSEFKILAQKKIGAQKKTRAQKKHDLKKKRELKMIWIQIWREIVKKGGKFKFKTKFEFFDFFEKNDVIKFYDVIFLLFLGLSEYGLILKIRWVYGEISHFWVLSHLFFQKIFAVIIKFLPNKFFKSIFKMK